VNIKLLITILIYWTVWSLVFVASGQLDTPVLDDTNNTIVIGNLTGDLEADETRGVGFWTSAISFGRFAVLVVFGVGLPSDTPVFFSMIFMALQTMVSIVTVGFFISSLWDG